MDSRTIAWSPANRGPLLKPSMSTSLWSRLPSRRYSACPRCRTARVRRRSACARPHCGPVNEKATEKSRPHIPFSQTPHRARQCHVRARTTAFPHSRGSSYGVGGGRLLIGRTCTHLRLPYCQTTAPPLQIRTLSRRRTRSNRNANQRQLSGVQAREMCRNRK